MNNNDLSGLPTGQVRMAPQQQPKGQGDPTEQFDLTRSARQEALAQVQDALTQVAEGAKISKKQIQKAIQGLYTYSKHTDELLVSAIRDMYSIVEAIASDRAQSFIIGVHIKSMIEVLDEKGVMTSNELEKAYQERLSKEREEVKKINAQAAKSPSGE